MLLARCLVVLGLAAAPSICWAEAGSDSTRIAARALGEEGVAAYQAGDYERASERLETAYEVLRVPSLALWSARALAARGMLVEASERLLEATRLEADPGSGHDIQMSARLDAERERAALLPRLPYLTVVVEGADKQAVTCTIGGEPFPHSLLGTPRATNPGRLEVAAAVGSEVASEAVDLKEGEKKTVVLRFALPLAESPSPASVDEAQAQPSQGASGSTANDASPRSWQEPTGLVAMGVGGLGMLAGLITGIVALDMKGGFDCMGDVCEEPQDSLNTYNDLLSVTTVALVSGGVVAAGGGFIFITAPRGGQTPTVGLGIGPRMLMLKGTF